MKPTPAQLRLLRLLEGRHREGYGPFRICLANGWINQGPQARWTSFRNWTITDAGREVLEKAISPVEAGRGKEGAE